MRKIKFAYLVTLIFFTPIFSQMTLNTVNASWTTVIPGKVISEPALTSYGFSLITDAHQISAFTNNGTILWEKQIDRSPAPIMAKLKDDFFAVVTSNGTKLSLLNPSGCEIWSKEIEFPVTSKPFSGRDGRFFIRGEKNLQCFGINGISKWKLETPTQSPLSPLELNDGSLVAFLQDKVDGKTKGLRISPYGEVLEEIIFSGEILNALSCNSGILLNFTDGTAGLFTVKENKAQNKWVLLISVNDENQIKTSSFVVSEDKQNVFFLLPSQTSIEVYQINQENGQIIHSFTITEINGYKLSNKYLTSEGILLIDETSARFYNYDANDLWNVKLPSKKSKDNYNYIIYTKDNHLILCGTNWSLNSYLVTQSASTKNSEKKEIRKYSDYIIPNQNDFALQYLNSIDKELISTERTNSLLAGNYGPKEIEWTNELLGYCQSFQSFTKSSDFGARTEKSPFETDAAGTNKMLSQLSLFSIVETTDYTALFLRNITNKSFTLTLLKGISQNGYDPSGKILDSIDIITSKYTNQDEKLIIATCDAVYSICLFMGRPAFNSKGKKILSKFLSSNYSVKARTSARTSLKKIADLDL